MKWLSVWADCGVIRRRQTGKLAPPPSQTENQQIRSTL
jgi:hypothetical protein